MNFWGIAGAMVLLALAFLVLPVLGRRAPSGSLRFRPRMALWLLAGLLPLTTLAMYLHLGAPGVLDGQRMAQARQSYDVNRMLSALEARLKQNPNDVEAMLVLGRAYLSLQRGAEAEAVLAKATRLAPDDARFAAYYAEVVAMNRNGDLQGTAGTWITQALELDQRNEKALELAGLAAYQRQDWAQAMHFWRRLLKRLPPDSEFHQDIAKAIEDAQEKSVAASGLGDRAKLTSPAKAPNPHAP